MSLGGPDIRNYFATARDEAGLKEIGEPLNAKLMEPSQATTQISLRGFLVAGGSNVLLSCKKEGCSVHGRCCPS